MPPAGVSYESNKCIPEKDWPGLDALTKRNTRLRRLLGHGT